MWTVGTDIFMFNETHSDNINPKTRMVLRCSEQRMLQQQTSFSAIQISFS